MSGTKSQPLLLQTSSFLFIFLLLLCDLLQSLQIIGIQHFFFYFSLFLFAFSSLVVSNVVCVNSNILPSVMSYGIMNLLRGAFISLMVF